MVPLFLHVSEPSQVLGWGQIWNISSEALRILFNWNQIISCNSFGRNYTFGFLGNRVLLRIDPEQTTLLLSSTMWQHQVNLSSWLCQTTSLILAIGICLASLVFVNCLFTFKLRLIWKCCGCQVGFWIWAVQSPWLKHFWQKGCLEGSFVFSIWQDVAGHFPKVDRQPGEESLSNKFEIGQLCKNWGKKPSPQLQWPSTVCQRQKQWKDSTWRKQSSGTGGHWGWRTRVKPVLSNPQSSACSSWGWD